MKVKNWLGEDTVFFDELKKFHELEIIQEFSMSDDDWEETYQRFPQTRRQYRNITNWVLLADGSAIGRNESPRSGISYPRIGKLTVSKNLNNFQQYFKE